MKWKVAILLTGMALGSAGTALSVTRVSPYHVPRGYAATFAGLPRLFCLNKPLGEPLAHVPKGTVAVGCLQSTPARPSYDVIFEFNRLSVLSPSGRVVFRART
jgi:hypothetical protein